MLYTVKCYLHSKVLEKVKAVGKHRGLYVLVGVGEGGLNVFL